LDLANRINQRSKDEVEETISSVKVGWVPPFFSTLTFIAGPTYQLVIRRGGCVATDESLISHHSPLTHKITTPPLLARPMERRLLSL